jgi:murein DD-endopeptidase MepM/ murein hydrolase activator NlpD
MKKFYYFSKNKLHFVEVENFYRKFIFLIFFFAVLVSFFVFGAFLVFNDYINPDSELASLKKKNVALKQKFEKLLSNFDQLDKKVNNLSDKNHNLRLAVNLCPLEKDEAIYGTGGNAFTPLQNLDLSDTENFLNSISLYTGKIITKSQQEINSITQIEKTVTDNEKLYDILPALKPSDGNFGDGFKVRFHPILRVRQMHNGVDIICDHGTKVYATGGGVVSFVGWRNGTGLTVEIDHGFDYRTIYGHLSKAVVEQGQNLYRGDLIALSGSSGSLSTGPHLHYEVRLKDIPLDPKNFMYDDVKISEIIDSKDKSH